VDGVGFGGSSYIRSGVQGSDKTYGKLEFSGL
jgi:hypothetical protein